AGPMHVRDDRPAALRHDAALVLGVLRHGEDELEGLGPLDDRFPLRVEDEAPGARVGERRIPELELWGIEAAGEDPVRTVRPRRVEGEVRRLRAGAAEELGDALERSGRIA